MAHLVRYRSSEGADTDHEVGELADAIAHVERLRNEQGVEGARIFRLEEVVFEYKPYFKVEIGPAAAPSGALPRRPAPPAPAPTAPSPELDTSMAPVWAPRRDEPEVEKVPAHMSAEPPPVTDPWADAPSAPVGETVVNGASRRGLFGR